jgi:hypothetical protein
MPWGSLYERLSPGDFQRPQRMAWRMPGGNLINVTLAGVVEVSDQNHVKGFKGAANWHRDEVWVIPTPRPAIDQLQLPIPPQGFEWQAILQQRVAYGALSSITNDGQAVNAGWAVDWLDVLSALGSNVIDEIILGYYFAVRDDDGYIWRLSYWVNFIADLHLGPIPPPPG